MSANTNLTGIARVVMESARKSGFVADSPKMGKEFASHIHKFQVQSKKKGGSLGKVNYNVKTFLAAHKAASDRRMRAAPQKRLDGNEGYTEDEVEPSAPRQIATETFPEGLSGEASGAPAKKRDRSSSRDRKLRESAALLASQRSASPTLSIRALVSEAFQKQHRGRQIAPVSTEGDVTLKLNLQPEGTKVASKVDDSTPVRAVKLKSLGATIVQRMREKRIGELLEGRAPVVEQPSTSKAPLTALKTEASSSAAPQSKEEDIQPASLIRPSARTTQVTLDVPVQKRKRSIEGIGELVVEDSVSTPSVDVTVAKPSGVPKVTRKESKPTFTIPAPKPQPPTPSFTGASVPVVGDVIHEHSSSTSKGDFELDATDWEAQRATEMKALREAQQVEEERILASKLEAEHQKLGEEWVQERVDLLQKLFGDRSGMLTYPEIKELFFAPKKKLYTATTWEEALAAFYTANASATISSPLPSYFYHQLRFKMKRLFREFGSRNMPYQVMATSQELLNAKKDDDFNLEYSMSQLGGQDFVDAMNRLNAERLSKLSPRVHRRYLRTLFFLEPAPSKRDEMDESQLEPTAAWKRALSYLTKYPEGRKLAAAKGTHMRAKYKPEELVLACLASAKVTVGMHPSVRAAMVSDVKSRLLVNDTQQKDLPRRMQVLLAAADRGPTRSNQLRELTRQEDTDEASYGSVLALGVAEDEEVLLLDEMKAKGLDVNDPVVVVSRMQCQLVQCKRESMADDAQRSELLSTAVNRICALYDSYIEGGHQPTKVMFQVFMKCIATDLYLRNVALQPGDKQDTYESALPPLLDRVSAVLKTYPHLCKGRHRTKYLIALLEDGRLEDLISHMGVGSERFVLEETSDLRKSILNSCLQKMGQTAHSAERFNIATMSGTTASASQSTAAVGGVDMPYLDALLEHAKNRDWESALDFIPKLPKKVPETQIPALTLLYNCVLSAAIAQPVIVESVLATMGTSNAEPNLTTYNTALSSFSRDVSRWEQSLMLYSSMPAEMRDNNSHAAAMSMLSKQGRWLDSLDLFKTVASFDRVVEAMELKKKIPGKPLASTTLYSMAIDAASQHNVDATLLLFRGLVREHGAGNVKEAVSAMVNKSLDTFERPDDKAIVERLLALGDKKKNKQVASPKQAPPKPKAATPEITTPSTNLDGDF